MNQDAEATSGVAAAAGVRAYCFRRISEYGFALSQNSSANTALEALLRSFLGLRRGGEYLGWKPV
jgi:hypothetical protein